MPTQRTFKRRVRARMTKTGEAYTAARRQLLRKADGPAQPIPTEATEAPGPEPAVEFPTSEEAVLSATGRSYPEWIAVIDAWGGTDRTHTEIARWLATEHGVPGWWAQSVTIAYERARGMRAVHQTTSGFTVGVTRTMATEPEIALAAFTDPAVRRRWLVEVGLRQRPTMAAGNARFDWPDPPSRLVVYAGAKGAGKTLVSISHERLPDAEAAAREKAAWRQRLGTLKALLEG